jgi:hypothetical protein
MMSILTEVKEKHCEACKMGSCGHEIGYLSPGTSMDYAYDDLKVNTSTNYRFLIPLHLKYIMVA